MSRRIKALFYGILMGVLFHYTLFKLTLPSEPFIYAAF